MRRLWRLFHLPDHELLDLAAWDVVEGQMAIIFNLDRPFAAQVAAAKHILKQAQKARRGKSVQRRKHSNKWLGYLRTLDAEAGGATWAQMAALHPHTAQKDKTVQNVLNQAAALCFNF